LPDGRLASANEGGDGTVRIWDPTRRTDPLDLHGHTGWVSALAVLPDGRLASAGHDSTVRIWDPTHGTTPLDLHGHTGELSALAVLPDMRLASAGHDRTVRIWDPAGRHAAVVIAGVHARSLQGPVLV
jgi:WD40 repeat protein